MSSPPPQLSKWCTWASASVQVQLTATAFLLALVWILQTYFAPSSLLQFNNGGAVLVEDEGGHGDAVWYRNAPWKPHIARWLSDCNDHVEFVAFNESIGGLECLNKCSNHGVCNRQLGQCRCFHGYQGKDCSEKINLQCNIGVSVEKPNGHWIVSICPAKCDTTRAFCFCGENTKYPMRPVAEACGFQNNELSVNWSEPDTQIFTRDKSIRGWCNVDPPEALKGNALYKEQCGCLYDGQSGLLCEIPVECSCINQCSGNGYCHGGFCQCKESWYGIDCSIPSVSSPLDEWPHWLQAAEIRLPDKTFQDHEQGLRAVVNKKRPLIYIYDLPPEFNSHLLEGRHFRLHCVNRLYSVENATMWTEQLYGSQIALLESLLSSSHRTTNADEADFFFVPVLDSCLITRADDSPHLRMKDYQGFRSYFTLDLYKKAFDHIMGHYPYWNRSAGRDHIWSFSWDEGACYAPKEIWNSTMLVHWGNTNSKHKHSTTAYFADNWDYIPIERKGTHNCYDPDKDLVIPAWKKPNPDSIIQQYWARPQSQRKTLFYFNGNLGPAFLRSRPEPDYSMGIRQRVAEEYASEPNKEGKLGRQSTKDVIVVSKKSPNYDAELANSIFCGVLPGDGWSGRLEDSVLHGCIPVIIQDGIHMPYENMLNYDSFSVRIAEDEIPQMIQILRNMNTSDIEYKVSSIRKIWQRFIYRDNVMLEAERQKRFHDYYGDWAVQYEFLKDDDVFSTVIQILHYKLYNDPWRLPFLKHKKVTGLPQSCIAQ